MSAVIVKEKHFITPFAGENFSAWSFRIKSILKGCGVLKAVEQENFNSDEANSKSEAKAQAIIIGAVADSHLEYLRDKNSAYYMYKNLEQNFEKKGTRSRLFLRRKLNEIKYNERDKLIEHFIQLEELFTQLKNTGCELSEEEKLNYILMSMPRSYENVVTALETIENLRYDFVKTRLLGEEEKKKKGNFNENRNVSNAFLCFECGKPGHKKYQCREYNNTKTNLQPSHSQKFNGQTSAYHRQHFYRQQARGNMQRNGSTRGHGCTPGRGRQQGSTRGRSREQERAHSSGYSSYMAEEETLVFCVTNQVKCTSVKAVERK